MVPLGTKYVHRPIGTRCVMWLTLRRLLYFTSMFSLVPIFMLGRPGATITLFFNPTFCCIERTTLSWRLQIDSCVSQLRYRHSQLLKYTTRLSSFHRRSLFTSQTTPFVCFAKRNCCIVLTKLYDFCFQIGNFQESSLFLFCCHVINLPFDALSSLGVPPVQTVYHDSIVP